MDVALDRSMIPLGSCTMKLNATTEMEAVTWPEFARMHPFAPLRDAEGYHELIGTLERWLCAVTEYDAVSLQPNAGSQGELAGLLAIRGYHAARGEAQRDVCLIPESAHGTNAASAVLHPARRRRPGGRPGGRPRAPGALPAAAGARRGDRRRDRDCRPVRLGGGAADLVGLHRDDGGGRAAPRHQRGGAVGELHRPAARPLLPGAAHRAARARRA